MDGLSATLAHVVYQTTVPIIIDRTWVHPTPKRPPHIQLIAMTILVVNIHTVSNLPMMGLNLWVHLDSYHLLLLPQKSNICVKGPHLSSFPYQHQNHLQAPL
ncbi:hypothetical protein DSO57_1028444 [Entomophthora muscae]|uniref:Uncharacterized protein n=1 Tax=Entomophthora muscae TaxID=34485 RepID=A0ACC2SEA8_9FUNG|nr:hypothetical protein DSO57_1028444 [Entomophthora muscae]